MAMAHEYLATSTRPLKCFARFLQRLKHFQTWVHAQNKTFAKNVLEPREVDGSKTFLQMFYFTCNHGQNKADRSFL